MNGECDLEKLVQNLAPILRPDRYVIGSVDSWPDPLPEGLLATIQEPEALTVIAPVAESGGLGLEPSAVFRCIRLNVHSSLQAVGLTAVISTRLARHGISANLLAGAYHDHLLVPEGDAERALRVLEELSSEAERVKLQ
tara:strand:+ start:16193 stop:16609 length:417 start_codon:yes stop_codon:yes gene_type:complete